MKSAFIDLLNQIAGGITIYEPLRRKSQDLQVFQDTVHRLQEMERLGLIGKLFIQLRSGSQGEDIVDLVMVQGGLTVDGDRMLREYNQSPSLPD